MFKISKIMKQDTQNNIRIIWS